MPPAPGTTLIVCVGNGLVADDAVGCEIFDRLQEQKLHPKVRTELLGVGGLALLELLDSEDHLIVVDAVQLGDAPGKIHIFDWRQLPANNSSPVSLHGIGVREALELGAKLYPERMPQKVTLVGIEGVCFDQFAVGLSPAVKQSVAPAVDFIIDLS